MKIRGFALLALLIIAVSIFVVVCYSIPTDVEQEILADIYVNGETAGQTTIRIHGQQRKWLFKNQKMTYVGEFQIDRYEPTTRDRVHAKIAWDKDADYQHIEYYLEGDFTDFDLTEIRINESMTEFAIAFSDGTIIATSTEQYTKYIQGAP